MNNEIDLFHVVGNQVFDGFWGHEQGKSIAAGKVRDGRNRPRPVSREYAQGKAGAPKAVTKPVTMHSALLSPSFFVVCAAFLKSVPRVPSCMRS
jgi:hypothetical protein